MIKKISIPLMNSYNPIMTDTILIKHNRAFSTLSNMPIEA